MAGQRASSSAPCEKSSRACRGAWARVNIDRCRHLALSTFEKHRASTNHPDVAGLDGGLFSYEEARSFVT
jgi:hypothetical protein